MFSIDIVKSDAFLDMPVSSQLLYFHLGMEADDDGFISNAKSIARMLSSSEDDIKILLAKRFLLMFPSGIVVIKHWKINNYIQSDRYTPSKYTEEKKALTTKENGAYTECIQNGYNLDTQVRLGEVREGKSTREQSSRLLEIPGIVRGSEYQPDGVSPRDIQDAKPKRERTDAQKAQMPRLFLMDYFRDEAKSKQGLSYLEREEDRNAKIKRCVDSAYSRFQEGTRLFIDWWFDGGGEWANYEPDACFMPRSYRAYENKEKIAEKPVTATRGRGVMRG